ncbi:hypothetical protein ON010_g978 [Phytophthora cinnamomi]|nr:hypothetical protein ON010_g978 [Phytophthora cinnamomi]
MTDVRPAEPEFQVVADYYLNQQAPSLPETFPTAPASPTRQGALKTTTSTGISTTTTDESMGEYQLDFEDDPFSVALNLPELRRSSGEEIESVDAVANHHHNNNEPTSSPEAVAGSFPSEIVVWEGNDRISVDDDFIPSTAIDRLQTDRLYANARLAESIEQRLLELNIQAEYTYAQTQENAVIMRQGERRR